MRSLREILEESKKAEDEKEKKLVFIETDPKEPFPNDTISALEKDIHKKAKDLTIEWKSSIELVDAAFEDLDVPKPMAHQTKRWEQYKNLLSTAINRLYDARGFKSGWVTTI